MGVLFVIMSIVFVYIMYKQDEQDKQDKLRRQKEAQEMAARLRFEEELKRKSLQWVNSSSFFARIVDPITVDINERIASAKKVKISRKEWDRFTLSCSDSQITIKKSYTTNYIKYKTFGFDDLQDDNSNSTIASLNLALFLYLKKRYQAIPGIVFSFERKSLTDYISTYDGYLHWDSISIECDITKVHPLLEKVTLP